MVHFVGAGPGATDLITLRGKALIEGADCIIYAGSLVNPELLAFNKKGAEVYNSAAMTLEEVMEVIYGMEGKGRGTVRLHTGDPSLYGAIREQMDILDVQGIPYDYCPGVSSFSGAAAALNMEYTLPEVSQSVIITRMPGRTPVPENEDMAKLAAHGATMVIFLSTGLLESLKERLLEGGYEEDTPAAIVYKASWPDEKKFICTVGTLVEMAKENGIEKTALIIIGDVVSSPSYRRSDLYNPEFSTEFRKSKQEK